MENIEKLIHADVFLYYGNIDPSYKQLFISEIENLAKHSPKENLAFNITTNGGSVEMVEVMVDVMRNFYKEIYFFVQDYAYSAGTILCMSGDKIYMSYASSLGPIDPQVLVNGKYVSAQGYIDQFEYIKRKSGDGTITPVELQMALNLNLADLNFYSQARNLTVALLKKWLVQYKFKDWTSHKTSGAPVTNDEKEQRAEEIAKTLGDNARWHSHGRHIGIKTLQDSLNLRIENLDNTPKLKTAIEKYNRLAIDFANKQGYLLFMHSKKSRG
ncbi:MAG: ATP-dependent Clp protease proteolytic subunit [Mailhella sp.]|nr:ATP-dependent Clp protease proteolytic subunit [Mailhella sp.]